MGRPQNTHHSHANNTVSAKDMHCASKHSASSQAEDGQTSCDTSSCVKDPTSSPTCCCLHAAFQLSAWQQPLLLPGCCRPCCCRQPCFYSQQQQQQQADRCCCCCCLVRCCLAAALLPVLLLAPSPCCLRPCHPAVSHSRSGAWPCTQTGVQSAHGNSSSARVSDVCLSDSCRKHTPMPPLPT